MKPLSNLPPGCTDADIDRQACGDELTLDDYTSKQLAEWEKQELEQAEREAIADVNKGVWSDDDTHVGPSAPDLAAELAALREQVRLLREALGYIESEAWGRDTMVSGIRRRIVDRASAALSTTDPTGGAT